MSTFERYLTVWVALCIVAGVALGHFFPTVFHAIGSAEVARVNIPVAILIWLMIIPMLLKIDFSALRQVTEHWRGIGVTLFINWAVKPFSMALLGWLFIGWLFRPYLPADQIDSYIAGLIILAAAPCTAMVFVWSNLTKGICPYRRATARTVGNYFPVGYARFVGCPLYRHSGDYRSNPTQKHSRQRRTTSLRCNAEDTTAAVSDCAFGDTRTAIRFSGRADHHTAYDHCDAGRPDPHPGLFQLWPRLSVESHFRRATLRRRSLGFDWCFKFLRTGSSSRNQPIRFLIWCGACNSGWRSC